MTVQYEERPIWKILFQLRGSVLKRIWPLILVNGILGGITGTIEHYYAKDHPAVFVKISPSLFHLLGLVISFFSVFRNSICYGRFWEARTALGDLRTACTDTISWMTSILLVHRDKTQAEVVIADQPHQQVLSKLGRWLALYSLLIKHHAASLYPPCVVALFFIRRRHRVDATDCANASFFFSRISWSAGIRSKGRTLLTISRCR